MAGRLIQTQQTGLASSDAENNGNDKANRLPTAASERFGNKRTYASNADSTIDHEQITVIGDGANDYDIDNQFTTITHRDGSVTAKTYSPLHQLATVKHGSNAVDGFAYDSGMQEKTQAIGDLILTSNYTPITGQKVVTTSAGSDHPGKEWDYSYDTNKNLPVANTVGVMAWVSHAFNRQRNQLTADRRWVGRDSFEYYDLLEQSRGALPGVEVYDK